MNTKTTELQSEIKAHWEKQILPFWSTLQDTTHGGFYGWVGNDLQVNQQAPKGGIATARQLWSLQQRMGLLETKDGASTLNMHTVFSPIM